MLHENGENIVHHVIRIERLEEELRTVVEAKWPDLNLNYATMSNTGDHKPYRGYYSSRRTSEIVAEFFKYDIEAFGYQFGDILAK